MTFTITELTAIGTFMIVLFGAIQAGLLLAMRARFAAKTCIFRSDGSQIYKTVIECEKMEKKRDKEHKEMQEHIEKDIKEKVQQIKDDNERFVKNLQNLFATQNQKLSDTITDSIKKVIQSQA